jgi:sec-independent protein translocase protein TatC
MYAMAGLSSFFFVFGMHELIIFEKHYFLPTPYGDSLSVQVFNKVRQDLLPASVELMVTNPMSAFVSQVSFSLLLAFLVMIPFFIYKIILYLQPALHPQEKKALLWAFLPFVFLFFFGCAFSYLFLIPATFKVLYPFATSIGAVTLFSLDEFVYYVSSLMVAVGVMFLLPLFMILLSMIGVVKAEFWQSKWRHAVLFFLLASAIITPDGTGITMAILFLPLALLYFAGYFFAKKLS